MQNLDFENTKTCSKYSIRIGDKLIDLSTPLAMGIVNITPDSFYATSRTDTRDELISRVEQMLTEGVSIVDIGGYSSRPGAKDVSIEDEIKRIVPAVQAISEAFPDLTISIDTFRSEVADAALTHGAHIINDISGFSIDPKIIHVAAKHNAPYILMHMRGTPQTMQTLTNYENLFREIATYFSKKISQLQDAGVNDIILDPGFGFSKTLTQNHQLLDHLEHFHFLEKPILAGLSRKSMIYNKINSTPDSVETLQETTRLNQVALKKGAHILRVHDVKEAVELITKN
ncbi:MAG: dihydropteroate synthase [Crocinitomicaceae bacterium]|nr:dihydropteroate synthase [Crocinitomicaceae bacterium]MDG1776805.1 dihydropteroate synthase [Crocinitomicaceae bacterium]